MLLPIYQTIGPAAVKYPSLGHSGDHIGKVLPVPIPNTEVKLFEPMIVHTSVKVGIAGFLKTPQGLCPEGFFLVLVHPELVVGERMPVEMSCL